MHQSAGNSTGSVRALLCSILLHFLALLLLFSMTIAKRKIAIKKLHIPIEISLAKQVAPPLETVNISQEIPKSFLGNQKKVAAADTKITLKSKNSKGDTAVQNKDTNPIHSKVTTASKEQELQVNTANKKQIINSKKLAMQQQQAKEKALAKQQQYQLEQKRLTQEKLLQKQQQQAKALAEKKKRLAELEHKKAQAAKIAFEKQQQELLQKQRIAQEQQKQLAQDRYDLQIARATLVDHLAKYLLQPKGNTSKWQTTLEIMLNNYGKVQSVKIINSSGSPLNDRIAVNTIYKAQPLPLPDNKRIREQFMHFTLNVSPKE